jgi:hypothetical protein
MLYKYLDAEAMKLLFVSVMPPKLEFENTKVSPKLEKDQNLVKCSKKCNKDNSSINRQTL